MSQKRKKGAYCTVLFFMCARLEGKMMKSPLAEAARFRIPKREHIKYVLWLGKNAFFPLFFHTYKCVLCTAVLKT